MPIYSVQAKLDLLEIYNYLASEADEQIAEKILGQIADACENFDSFPMIGRARDDLDLAGEGLRSFVCGSYSIFYRVTEGRAVVVRVLHGSRDISERQFRGPNTN